MDVIDCFGEAAVVVAAGILFHELFKAIFVQLFIFHVKVLVLFHVSFVFKGELTTGAVTMKVRGFLTAEWTIVSSTILTASKPEKSFTLDSIVLSVVVKVHLHIRS